MANTEEAAKAAARRANSSGKDFSNGDVKSFLNGTLYEVNFTDTLVDKDGDDDGLRICYVYCTLDNEYVFGDAEQIVDYVSYRHHSTSIIDKIFELMHGSGVASLIAVIITCVIAWIAVSQIGSSTDIKIPQELTTALTTILGFYFGQSTVTKNAASASPPVYVESTSSKRRPRDPR